MKISNKISLSFLIAGLILTTAAATITYIMFRNNLKESIFVHLSTTAQSRARHIETFLEEHKQAVEVLAEEIMVKELLSTSKDAPEYNEYLDRVNSRINNLVKINIEIFKVELSDKNGIVVASTEEASVDSDISADEIYLKGKEAAYIRDIHISEADRKPALDMSAPVLLNDEFLGVIVIDLYTEMLFEILLDRTGLGETGEIYLVNKDYYMISPSRFREDVILNQKVDTINSRNGLMSEGKEPIFERRNIFVFKDYRGINVLGTSVYMPEMQWALLAEIDEKEALLPLDRIRVLFVIIVVFFSLGLWLMGVLLSRSIVKPIIKLQKGTEIIAQGNLDYKIGIDSKDEMGQLSRAFDKMTDDLKRTTTSIDKLNKEMVWRKKKEEELTRLSDELVLLIETANAPIFGIDVEGKVNEWNRATERITGYKKKDVMGKDFVENFITEDFKASVSGVLHNALKGKETANYELPLYTKDGKHLFVLLNASSRRDVEGKITGVLGIGQNITERRRAERRQKQLLNELNIIVNSVGDALMVMDNNLIVRTVNPAFLDLTGKKKEELLGKPCRDILKCINEKGEDLCAGECASKKTVSKGTKFIERSVIQNSEGKMITVASINSPLMDSEGKVIGSVKAMRDISKEVEIDRMKTEFISTVSHELRTPLTSIEGYIDLILDGDTGEINELQREFLGIVFQSTKRLENLINDLLDVEKIESGKTQMKVEKISLDNLVKTTVKTMKPVAEKKGLKLISQIEEGIEITGDSDRIIQVLTNLISNAIKFTKKGKVTVVLKLINGNYEMIVQDTGVGISRSDQKELFTKFFRSDDEYTKDAGGTGLGLSIAGDIVKRFGGEIRVKSELNKGSEFRVILPLGKRRKKQKDRNELPS